MRLKSLLDFTVVLALAIAAYNLHGGFLDTIMSILLAPLKDNLRGDVDFWCRKLLVPVASGFFVYGIWLAYNRTLWHLISKLYYEAGWWIYAIHVETPSSEFAEVEDGGTKKRASGAIGLFYLDLTGNRPSIQHAESYYVSTDPNDVDNRGSWKSNNVWLSSDRIEILYSFDFDPGQPHEKLQSYMGAVVASKQKKRPLLGKTTWRGKFFILGQSHTGAVYAEKLSFRYSSFEKAKAAAHSRRMELLECAQGN